MVQERFKIDRPGRLPDSMDFKILLITPLDQVLHTDFLLPIGMKIVHGSQAKTIGQMVIIQPTEFVSLYISGRHKKYFDALTGDIFPELPLLQKLHNTESLIIIRLAFVAIGWNSKRSSVG